MADRPVFGRRQRDRGIVGAPMLSTIKDGRPEHRLGKLSQVVQIVGELAAFVGLLVVFIATQWQPPDPSSLSGLGGLIYIPEVLRDLITFNDPRPVSRGIVVAYTKFDWPIEVLFFAAGAIAIMRRSWILTGLICAFLAFPWGMVGYSFSSAPAVLGLFSVMAFFRIVRLSRRTLFILVPIGAIFGPLLTGVIVSLFSSAFGTPARSVRYDTVQFSQLEHNENKPATERGQDGKPVVRVASLAGLVPGTPEQKAAKAYVMAQELALRGNAAAAAQAAQEAAAGGAIVNPFDKRRLNIVTNFSIANGVAGEEARDEILSRYRSQSTLSRIVLVAGIALCLVGFFADIISTRISQRARRVEQMKFDMRKAELVGKDTSLPSEVIESMAAVDAVAVVEAIARRIRLYRIAAVIFAGLVLFGFYWAYALHLPERADNTAFGAVSLHPDALEFWRTVKLAGSGQVWQFSFIWWLLTSVTSPFSLLFILFITFPLWREFHRIVLYGSVGLALTFMQLQPLELIREPAISASVASFNPTVLQQLGTAAHSPSERPKGGNAHGNETSTVLTEIDRSIAAYTLAQIAYIEGRPADASAFLSLIDGPRVLTSRIANQRVDLMLEWTEAHGYPVSNLAWRPNLSMALTRTVARAFLGISFVFLAILLTLSGLIVVASRRDSRIRSLVEARQQM